MDLNKVKNVNCDYWDLSPAMGQFRDCVMC